MENKNKPNFLVVGAAKSGTTSLFHYLNQHPDIFIPEVKECRFFSQLPKNFNGLGAEFFQNSGITDEKQYFKFFDGYENKVCGDISNDYLYYHYESIKNIKKYLSDEVKIIIILRNPIDRAYSNYLHAVRDGWEDCNFEEAIIKENWRKNNNWAWPYHYIKAGMYFEQVKAYLDNFKNVKIYLFEDMKKDFFYKDIFAFLNISYVNIQKEKIYNVSGVPKNQFIQKFIKEKNLIKDILKPMIPKEIRTIMLKKIESNNLRKIPMKIETREYLKNIFKNDINNLSRLINRDLAKWLENKDEV